MKQSIVACTGPLLITLEFCTESSSVASKMYAVVRHDFGFIVTSNTTAPQCSHMYAQELERLTHLNRILIPILAMLINPPHTHHPRLPSPPFRSSIHPPPPHLFPAIPSSPSRNPSRDAAAETCAASPSCPPPRSSAFPAPSAAGRTSSSRPCRASRRQGRSACCSRA